jgi:hypothetical protein
MKAVWSFWSKPFAALRKSSWLSEKHHLLAWVLSVERARQHYPATALFTDDEGARLLVDGIGLRFDSVSTELNALAGHDPQWWALGKLWTYKAQAGPFVHIDSDVFLWKRLHEALESADVFAQNPEYFVNGESFYKPELFEHFLSDGWLPEEWTWYRSAGGIQRGECCGILGGNNTDFIRHFASQAIRMVEHPRNERGWSLLGDKSDHNILLEQYMLAACVEFHRGRQDSRYSPLKIEYLFSSQQSAHVPENAIRAGFTHLMSNAKRNAAVVDDLEKRVERDYPHYHERCVRLSERF